MLGILLWQLENLQPIGACMNTGKVQLRKTLKVTTCSAFTAVLGPALTSDEDLKKHPASLAAMEFLKHQEAELCTVKGLPTEYGTQDRYFVPFSKPVSCNVDWSLGICTFAK